MLWSGFCSSGNIFKAKQLTHLCITYAESARVLNHFIVHSSSAPFSMESCYKLGYKHLIFPRSRRKSFWVPPSIPLSIVKEVIFEISRVSSHRPMIKGPKNLNVVKETDIYWAFTKARHCPRALPSNILS